MATLTQKRSCGQVMQEWKEFMWNPRTREFMGRTASSWALIVTFYLVFYAFLTGMFVLSMWVMLQTIDDYVPKYSDRLANPGLMIRPKTDGLEIVYTLNNTGSWGSYVSAINAVLDEYNSSVQMQRGSVCPSGKYNIQEDTGEVRNNPKKACQFLRSSLGPCSGEQDPTYGYRDGSPCVLIKMNRVINFRPVPIGNLSAITVSCSGKTSDTDVLLGNRTYFPSNGTNLGTMDLMYFPYYGNKAQKNYTQPLVAVQFNNIKHNTDIFVECHVNAANIKNNDDRDKFAGRVIFKLRVNS